MFQHIFFYYVPYGLGRVVCVEVAVLVVCQLELGSTGDGVRRLVTDVDHTEGLCLMAAPALESCLRHRGFGSWHEVCCWPCEMGLCG